LDLRVIRGARQDPEVELGSIRRYVDLDLVAPRKLAEEDLFRERILDVPLDRPA